TPPLAAARFEALSDRSLQQTLFMGTSPNHAMSFSPSLLIPLVGAIFRRLKFPTVAEDIRHQKLAHFMCPYSFLPKWQRKIVAIQPLSKTSA
ncbi:MAG: hypothetical protein NZ781_12550, partial [Armatimonadetes bacterium]|nr:hypothetical protein [Armatimonadota bacterium]